MRVIDSGTASAAIAMLGLAIQRRLERGTTDEEIDALVERVHVASTGLLFTVETLEYLRRGGRIGRAAALAGRHALDPADPDDRRRRGRAAKRVRGNHKAFLEFAREFESRSRDVARAARSGSRTRTRRRRPRRCTSSSRRARPQADIELSTTLGPVLGTHAGPGCVGFFWFEDT